MFYDKTIPYSKYHFSSEFNIRQFNYIHCTVNILINNIDSIKPESIDKSTITTLSTGLIDK